MRCFWKFALSLVYTHTHTCTWLDFINYRVISWKCRHQFVLRVCMRVRKLILFRITWQCDISSDYHHHCSYKWVIISLTIRYGWFEKARRKNCSAPNFCVWIHWMDTAACRSRSIGASIEQTHTYPYTQSTPVETREGQHCRRAKLIAK